MAASSVVSHFFGFCEFFRFGEDERRTGSSNIEQNHDMHTFHSTPTKIKLAQPTFFDSMSITWANIFSLYKGKVKVCGWRKGENISPKEDIVLPLDMKVVSISTCWDKVLLITDQGKCHVMWNVYDDSTVHEVTSENANGKTFSSGCIGDSHCIVVDNNGVAYEINENKTSRFFYSQISLQAQVDQVCCGKEHVLLLSKNHGTIYSFGLGSRGQLGLGQVNPEKTPQLIEALAGIRIKQIACGGWHSMALSEFGDVYAWGWNECGQLGITCVPPEVSLSFYMLPYIVEFPQDECAVTWIACGSRHSVAVTSEKNVWTWGWGCHGQLGHGDTENRSTPALVEYFKDMDSDIWGVTCGPWQTVVHTKTKLGREDNQKGTSDENNEDKGI